MKLPFKYIAILVIVSLAGIFAYQAYWLTGLARPDGARHHRSHAHERL